MMELKKALQDLFERYGVTDENIIKEVLENSREEMKKLNK